MSGALVLYYSRSGNTKQMAEIITEGIKKEGIAAVLKDALGYGARIAKLLKKCTS